MFPGSCHRRIAKNHRQRENLLPTSIHRVPLQQKVNPCSTYQALIINVGITSLVQTMIGLRAAKFCDKNVGIDDLLRSATVNGELVAGVNHPARHRVLPGQTRLLHQPMVVHGDVASQSYSRHQQVQHLYLFEDERCKPATDGRSGRG